MAKGLRKTPSTSTERFKTPLLTAVKKALPRIDDIVLHYIEEFIGSASKSDFPNSESIYKYFEPLVLRQDFTAPANLSALSIAVLPFVDPENNIHESLFSEISDHSADSDDLDDASNSYKDRIAPRRLPNGPISLMDFAGRFHSVGSSTVDTSLAGSRTVASRVDSKKLEKAEMKIRQKMVKRQTAIEVSFKTIDRTQIAASGTLSDSHIRDLLEAKGKACDIHLLNFDISIASLRILTSASLSLVFGRRYGLVGRNGIGKSTLLKNMAGREILGMERYNHISIGYLEQELVGDDTPCLESVVKADLCREYLLREEASINALLASPDAEVSSLETRLKSVMEKIEEIEANTAHIRAGAILTGLGFSQLMQKSPTKEFSGGWKMRIALARALFIRPDLLLLDEPTNHLDIPAVVWISAYLAKWKGTLLVVSHDREFLDAVSTDILHMHDERVDVYKGNFSIFESSREDRMRQATREYETQLQYRRHLQDFVDRWRYNANRAAQAQSKLKILEKLPELEVPTEEIQSKFSFPDPEKVSPPVLQLQDVNFFYPKSPEKLIVSNVNLDVQMTSRIAVVGPNGAGKSTILKLLTGALSPTTGVCFRNGRLRFAFFSQHHVDALEDFNLTPVEFLGRHFPGHKEEDYRRQLGCFGISGRVGLQAMGTLSGGQKSRVVFASLALQRPSILVLDEPTNHLDYLSVDSLAEALVEFKGGVIIVSHDQKFIDSVCNEIWVCDKGLVTKFKGDSIKDYRKSLNIQV